MRRTLPTVAATLVWLVALAAPAAAHSVSGVSASNFQTKITSVEPAVPGVRVKVIEAGSRLELTNTTTEDVIVFGYQDEPYLRVGPRGVFENRRSPAVYLNAVRKGNVAVPGTADAEAAPQWVKVSDAHTVRWHDHRTHWMNDDDPPAVRRAPGERHVIIPAFEVPFERAGTRAVIGGTLTWIPGPSPAPWWLLVAGLLAVTVALALLVRRWGPVLAVLLTVLVVVDAVHALGIAMAAAGSLPSQLGKLAAGSFASFVAWGVAMAGIPFLRRQNDDGLWFAAFAALFITLVGGLSDVADLSRSQVPFAWDAALARALVAATLGLGAGITVASGVLLARHRTPAPTPDGDLAERFDDLVARPGDA